MRLQSMALIVCCLIATPACYDEGNLSYFDGEWQVREGFETQWLTEEDHEDWETTAYPLSFDGGELDGRFSGHVGFITARVELSDSLVTRILDDGAMALESGIVSDVVSVYINQHRVAQIGSVEPYEPGLYQRIVTDIPVDYLNAEGRNYLSFVFYSNGEHPNDVPEQPGPFAGVANDVFAAFYGREMVSFGLLSLYFAVGFYHLLLYARRRVDLYNLFFGLFCVGVSIYWSFRMGLRDDIWGDYVNLRTTVEYVILFSLGPALISFATQFFERRYTIAGLVYSGACGLFVIGAVALYQNYRSQHLVLLAWQLTTLIFLIYFIYFLIRQSLRRNLDAIFLSAGFVLFLVAVIQDLAAVQGAIETPQIARYVFPLFLLGIATVLATRFMRVHNEVEELNINLEQKVEERTRQLQKSLNEVRELKVQQDGDYFLTSLLIKPLGGNFASSKNVDVDILVRQKKRFQFREWTAEIGGDLCSAHTIQLRGRSYTALLNGDAMGKSIQGAGGALVLGVVFKSVITRTQLSGEAQAKYPERWLKDCFAELQNIFVSFDGTMLISAVLGLVDDETGLFYWINAEHPWVVLYRDDKARFVEQDLILRKIGIEGLEGQLYVKTFQLKPKDVILMGSDGRDDVLLGVDDRGTRVINEDEYRFLRHVETGRSSLEVIQDEILKDGELTDDFTLVRASYKEDAPMDMNAPSFDTQQLLQEAAQLFGSADYATAAARYHQVVEARPDIAEAQLGLARSELKQKNYTSAKEAFLGYVEIRPGDTHALYQVAYTGKLSRDLHMAADYGERVRLREPALVANLVNLADIYRLLGVEERARKILDEALQHDANDANARKLQGMMLS